MAPQGLARKRLDDLDGLRRAHEQQTRHGACGGDRDAEAGECGGDPHSVHRAPKKIDASRRPALVAVRSSARPLPADLLRHDAAAERHQHAVCGGVVAPRSPSKAASSGQPASAPHHQEVDAEQEREAEQHPPAADAIGEPAQAHLARW